MFSLFSLVSFHVFSMFLVRFLASPTYRTYGFYCFFHSLGDHIFMFFNVFHLRPCQPHIPNSCFNVLWPSRFRDFHVLAAVAEIILEQAASQEERKLRQQRAGGGHSLLNKPRAKVRTSRANSSARRGDIPFKNNSRNHSENHSRNNSEAIQETIQKPFRSHPRSYSRARAQRSGAQSSEPELSARVQSPELIDDLLGAASS